MRVALRIELTEAERVSSTKWSRVRSTPARFGLQAKIVLLAAEDSVVVAVEGSVEPIDIDSTQEPVSVPSQYPAGFVGGEVAWSHDTSAATASSSLLRSYRAVRVSCSSSQSPCCQVQTVFDVFNVGQQHKTASPPRKDFGPPATEHSQHAHVSEGTWHSANWNKIGVISPVT
ncbi:hypothetical protein KOR42_51540 [Thalassoglobus neptunius]|uniref:Uncharacterized protein n=1 Tax=Thalassoglobus neptunius TaxID=1938619 RepID=A0A5C5VNZ3_9PLAN|nr:hypothetical protein [Thalassoglobus neptunius]TWT39800.1 hypothetical protein KOR42_51540 [Thalassoglobus neptunius]